jgi:glycosyltransferase involved in cell wall biosynthesis
MACGTPVIASDVGGLRYSVVHRETGLLAPARNHAAFASALSLLLDDPALRLAMGAAAQRLVGRAFTWETIASRLEDLYLSVLPVGRPGAEQCS